ENSLFAFNVDKNQTKLVKIVESENLSESIKNYRIQLSTFNSKHVIPEALSKVEQHLTNLNKSQIIIIPTDLLSLIPFETLVTDYTHSKFSISYSCSLNLLAEQWNTKHTLSPPNVGIFAAKQTQNNSSNYLPYLTKEIESISNFCSATVFEVASKHEFLSNASKFNILHLATHSSIDNENPELSHLAFQDDELLVAELYNQTLTSNLAVLSACDTGNGYLLNGEGAQSISKAFTYAGIPSTVMSLWKVDDKATAQLMGSFYKHLQDGQPKDVALKLAKQDYLQLDIDQELKHPYYWSGFVLSGNTEPFKKEQPFNYWYLSFLILPIAALAFLKLKA
ncbi:MAG TPA: CHAT domain-containing protein, partial [Flavobacteriaceae bacterium]|nr:CHAT domain-containing protein [Flavobacteriaceae bacterium]